MTCKLTWVVKYRGLSLQRRMIAGGLWASLFGAFWVVYATMGLQMDSPYGQIVSSLHRWGSISHTRVSVEPMNQVGLQAKNENSLAFNQ